MAARIAARIAARYVSRRRLSSSGKILSEEEKAAENVYIKKMEQDKLEKLARKGPKTDEASAASHGGVTGIDAKPSVSSTSGVEKVSIDKYRNYAVLAGTITALGAIGWYVKELRRNQKYKTEMDNLRFGSSSLRHLYRLLSLETRRG